MSYPSLTLFSYQSQCRQVIRSFLASLQQNNQQQYQESQLIFSPLFGALRQIHTQYRTQHPGFSFENVLDRILQREIVRLESAEANGPVQNSHGTESRVMSLLTHAIISLFHASSIDSLLHLHLCGLPVQRIIITFVTNHIKQRNNAPSLHESLSWLETHVFPLLDELQFDSQWKDRLRQILYRETAQHLITNIFNIIIEFPDSLNLIMDLKECLIHTGMHKEMVYALRDANRKRLLHLGAHTNDIIIQYTNIIKTLNILDPTGVSLNLVSHDINLFLRNRKDAIRYFVNSIIDEDNDLFEELMNGETNAGASGEAMEDTEGATTDQLGATAQSLTGGALGATSRGSAAQHTFAASPYMPHFWAPKSLYPDPSKQQTKKPSIITIFVNIFQNIDLFVNEYQSILSQQLLKNVTFDTTNPYKILELLKVRFGENSLQKCEVMLKDIVDSKRLYKNIHERVLLPRSGPYAEYVCRGEQNNDDMTDETAPTNISAKIISKFYWPSIPDEKPKLHPLFENFMRQYEQQYSHLKSPRHLSWLPCLGSIQFELEIEDTSVELSASPVDASILMYLSENGILTSQQLAQFMEVSVEFVEKRLKYWVLRGLVVKNTDSSYQTISELDENFDPDAEVDEDVELKDSEDEVDETVDDFVKGILGHFKKASVDTIHHLLSISIDSFDKTVPQLQQYLCTRKEFFEYDAAAREFILLTAG